MILKCDSYIFISYHGQKNEPGIIIKILRRESLYLFFPQQNPLPTDFIIRQRWILGTSKDQIAEISI